MIRVVQLNAWGRDVASHSGSVPRGLTSALAEHGAKVRIAFYVRGLAPQERIAALLKMGVEALSVSS